MVLSVGDEERGRTDAVEGRAGEMGQAGARHDRPKCIRPPRCGGERRATTGMRAKQADRQSIQFWPALDPLCSRKQEIGKVANMHCRRGRSGTHLVEPERREACQVKDGGERRGGIPLYTVHDENEPLWAGRHAQFAPDGGVDVQQLIHDLLELAVLPLLRDMCPKARTVLRAPVMTRTSDRSPGERSEIQREMEALVVALPETDAKGKLRGALIRLRESLHDAAAFEAEFKKLAALSEKVARESAATRLHAAVERRLTGQ